MPPKTITIEGPLLDQSATSEPILRALPDWFGIEESVVQYVKDTDRMPTFVAEVGDEPAGFLTINRHFEHAAEIHVIAVLPQHHREGIGRELVTVAEAWLADQGVEYLQVKTVGPSRPCEHYGRTRRFYEGVGFRPLEEMKTLWSEANPCLVMVKRIEPS